MSIVRILHLYCDFCDPPEPPLIAPDSQWTAWEHRRRAASSGGWDTVRVDGVMYDRCGRCRDQGKDRPVNNLRQPLT